MGTSAPPWPIKRGLYNFQSLRSMPTALPLTERLHCEAIGYAGDAIHLSMGRLYDTLFAVHLRAEQPQFEPNHEEHVAIFVDAWSIIDQMYALARLLKKRDPQSKIEQLAAFRRKAGSASLLRNYMDHLGGNMNTEKSNLIVRPKGPPLFGALTFTWMHPSVQRKAGRWDGHLMWYLPASGHHVSTRLDARPHSKMPRTAPIDNVILCAGKEECNLTEIVGLALEAIQYVADEQRQVAEGLINRAIAAGETVKVTRAKSEYSCEITTEVSQEAKFVKSSDLKITEISGRLDPAAWQTITYPQEAGFDAKK